MIPREGGQALAPQDQLERARDLARSGRFREAVELAEELVRTQGAPAAVRAETHRLIGYLQSFHLYDTSSSALEHMHRAVAAAEESGKQRLIWNTLVSAAGVATQYGEYDRALAWAGRVMAAAEDAEVQVPAEYAFAAWANAGWAEFCRANYGSAEQACGRALQVGERSHSHYPHVLVCLALVRCALGRPNMALSHLAEARELTRAENTEALARIALATARAQLQLHQGQEAEGSLSAAEALIAMTEKNRPLYAEYFGLNAWLAARAGKFKDAREWAARACQVAEECGRGDLRDLIFRTLRSVADYQQIQKFGGEGVA